MEPSTTGEPAKSHGNHTNKHHSLHSQLHDHHHGILSSTSILIVIISAISVVLVLTIFLIIAMLRRHKSSKNRGSCRDLSSCNTSKFVAHTTISFTSSPDVNGGCLYGSNLGHKPPSKHKGVQVFTYKELEIATNKFSASNVIGNGGYGVVYRGTLSDGTVAAIKMLHREGKQGERAFRILTGRIPIDTKRPSGEHVLVSWALPRLTNRDKVMEMVDPALQGQYLMKDLIQVAAIAAVCVQPEADYRPLMTDVVQSLVPLVKNLSSVSSTGSSRFMN
ncbi:hypothetical protein H0E87_023194 [Populus deltoides]|uniref:Protein kinase domain-containing protein n=1 Tax=Populus deltoides TaxID=3696 RepID=A0A8T2XCZ0_POPDE|nr:hypothetical protein H0E87_023194 [Populus deltoides]